MRNKDQSIGRKGLAVAQMVLTEQIGAVAILTLNREERHNSLVPSLLEDLLAALEAIGKNQSLQAVVLEARGRSFSTGGDMAGFYQHLDHLEAYAAQIVGLLNQAILALVRLPAPVVAAVHGIVTGGSLGLVLGCDVILVTPGASFTPYYSVIGFSPDGGWTAMLPAIIGPKRTSEVLFRNLTVTAQQAVDWGLASREVPAEQIHDEALVVAKDIAAKKQGSILKTKRLLSLTHGNLAASLEAERLRFVQQIGSEEAQLGITAFMGARGK